MFSFVLPVDFVDSYRSRQPSWGYKDAGGNSLGEITFVRTYSRVLEDGSKETWVDVCNRVINGMFSIQKNWAHENRLPWSDTQAVKSAMEAFDRMYNFKWLPPGRGLWMMGTDYVMSKGTSSALQNCAFISTDDFPEGDPAAPFGFLMEASMLGVGVGFDTEMKDTGIRICEPDPADVQTYVIPDTREGWVESVKLLINSYLVPGSPTWTFDYMDIRPAGEPIAGFGGTSSGPDPLIKLHSKLAALFDGRAGDELRTVDVVDVGNLIGVCVVSGNVRRCMPEGTRVHLTRGSIPIEDVVVGDRVVTPAGSNARVTAVLDQGPQSTIKIEHAMGYVECTPNHRVAVFNSPSDWEFKEASKVTPGDHLVWDYWGIDGSKTHLPPAASLDVPALDVDVAWLMGMVFAGFEIGKVSQGSLVTDYAFKVLEKFGTSDVTVSNFEHYVQNLGFSDGVPQWIFSGLRPTREAFLAGVFDATGFVEISSTEKLVKDIALVGTSLGFGLRVVENGASFGLELPGLESSERILRILGAYSKREFCDLKVSTSTTFGYSTLRSGARPLPVLNVVSSRVADTYDIEVENIEQFTAEGVVVHNSALLALGKPDDEDFTRLKDPQWFPERNSYDPEDPGWGWMSNNTIEAHVGMDYTPYLENIALNGEPGFAWMDLTRAYGRLGDEPNDKDYRSEGYNPCLAGETLIHTTEGPRRIDELTEPFWAVVDGKAYKATASWVSGVKDIYRLTTKEGYEVLLTENHKILTASGEWIEAADLNYDDRIVLNNNRQNTTWKGKGTFEEGYLLGSFFGDGGVESGTPVVKVWQKDTGSRGVREELLRCSNTLKHRSDWVGWRDHGRGYEVMTLPWTLLKKFSVSGSREFTKELHTSSSNFHRGFLKGFFDADGHIEQQKTCGPGVIVSQVDRNRLVEVQRMLLRLGIKSRMYLMHPAGKKLMPDGKGGLKEYSTQTSYRLRVSTNDIEKYAELISFANFSKTTKLEKIIKEVNLKSKPFVARAMSFEYVRTDKVYDLTVESVHSMDANGLIVHNCAEQNLESGELCVSGETLIHTKTGVETIKNLVGQEVEIWNGENWAPVTPFYTGENELYRVTLSDGSYLDATPAHEWSVKHPHENLYSKKPTTELCVGMALPLFNLENPDGKPYENAYEKGQEMGKDTPSLPEEAFNWDTPSIRQFFQGWQGNSKTQLYATEKVARQAQILARRIGVNNATIEKNEKQYVLNIPTEKMPTEQTIVSIEKIADSAPTYCFNEPVKGMGVFGNVLTYQCTLVEVFLNRHDSVEDFKRTLKFAYMYGKTVTLLPTHWPNTNAIMQRNRRIGCSISGIAAFADTRGLPELRTWMENGYEEVSRWDKVYSEWLCVRESIKTTTVKPSGCRPAEALTTTEQGILTLPELFTASGHIDGEDWADLDGYSAVQGAEPAQKITKTYDNNKAQVHSIVLSYGMELRSTADHRWWVESHHKAHQKNGKGLKPVGKWVRTQDLTPGDVLDVRPGVYTKTTEAPLLPLNERAISMRNDAYPMTQPTHMNPDLAWALGYLWGDGAMSPNRYRIRFTDANYFNMEKISRILKEQFELETTVEKRSGESAYEATVASKMLWHWLIKNNIWKYYADSLDQIPEVVRRSSQESIIAFLAGLIDADGHVVPRDKDKTVGLTSADTELARHVQDVSAAAGIVFGRSHSTKGENFQKRKSVWFMTMAPETTAQACLLLAKHSNKMAQMDKTNPVPWSPISKKRSATRILGKVQSVEALGEQETFDVEVENSHWYYAGAVKSHNTVSILSGSTPGVHWTPGGKYFLRAIRFADNDPMLPLFRNAGYVVEDDVVSDNTQVVYFPIATDHRRSDKEVSIFEKIHLASFTQKHWSDNSVSVTVSFDPETEAQHIGTVLHMHEGQLKTVSFLPQGNKVYPQMPYTPITKSQYIEYLGKLDKISLDTIYSGTVQNLEAQGEVYCTTDRCEMPTTPAATEFEDKAEDASRPDMLPFLSNRTDTKLGKDG